MGRDDCRLPLCTRCPTDLPMNRPSCRQGQLSNIRVDGFRCGVVDNKKSAAKSTAHAMQTEFVKASGLFQKVLCSSKSKDGQLLPLPCRIHDVERLGTGSGHSV